MLARRAVAKRAIFQSKLTKYFFLICSDYWQRWSQITSINSLRYWKYTFTLDESTQDQKTTDIHRLSLKRLNTALFSTQVVSCHADHPHMGNAYNFNAPTWLGEFARWTSNERKTNYKMKDETLICDLSVIKNWHCPHTQSGLLAQHARDVSVQLKQLLAKDQCWNKGLVLPEALANRSVRCSGSVCSGASRVSPLMWRWNMEHIVEEKCIF